MAFDNSYKIFRRIQARDLSLFFLFISLFTSSLFHLCTNLSLKLLSSLSMLFSFFYSHQAWMQAAMVPKNMNTLSWPSEYENSLSSDTCVTQEPRRTITVQVRRKQPRQRSTLQGTRQRGWGVATSSSQNVIRAGPAKGMGGCHKLYSARHESRTSGARGSVTNKDHSLLRTTATRKYRPVQPATIPSCFWEKRKRENYFL